MKEEQDFIPTIYGKLDVDARVKKIYIYINEKIINVVSKLNV